MPSIDDLMQEIEHLRAENDMLKMLLKENGITLPIVATPASPDESPANTAVTKRSPLSEKITLFLSLFQGRPDVYARRWESKNGRSGYSPVCKNEWKPDVCLKPKGKCADCSHAEYCAYDENAVESHLSGHYILGIYPLLPDETCRFLAIDFDEENWRGDVQMVSAACRENDISSTKFCRLSPSAEDGRKNVKSSAYMEPVKIPAVESLTLLCCNPWAMPTKSNRGSENTAWSSWMNVITSRQSALNKC